MDRRMAQTWRAYLKEIYYNPEHPASYEGINKIYEFIKKEGKFKISKARIKNWLQNQQSYSLNKPVKRKFKRGRVIVSGIDDQFDIDLASMIPLAPDNDNFKYLLMVIDIFSRYGWVVPLKDKTAPEIIKGFKEVLFSGRKPQKLRSDAGSEFTSKEFKKFLKKEGITHFTTHSEKQANYVERFIKTIKGKIYRYMTEKSSNRYIDILPNLVRSYNNTWHSGILSEPVNVNKENESRLWWQMYWPEEEYIKKEKPCDKRNRQKKFIFKVGDKVRISYLRKSFQREYDTKWSYEIFVVTERFLRQDQPIYRIADWFGDPLEGTFYQKELQKVDTRWHKPWKVQEVFDSRGLGKKKEYLVKWLGWPKKFNTWINYKEYNKLK